MLSLLPIIARFRGLLAGLLTGNADDRNVLKTSFEQATLIEQITAIATAFTLAEERIADTDSCRILLEWVLDALKGYGEGDAPGLAVHIVRLWHGANQSLLELNRTKTPDHDTLHKLTIAAVAVAEQINMHATDLV